MHCEGVVFEAVRDDLEVHLRDGVPRRGLHRSGAGAATRIAGPGLVAAGGQGLHDPADGLRVHLGLRADRVLGRMGEDPGCLHAAAQLLGLCGTGIGGI